MMASERLAFCGEIFKQKIMWTLQYNNTNLGVQPLGGMIAQLDFETEKGNISPLITTDWAEKPNAEKLHPVIRNMQGEWFCLPFGAPSAPPTLPEHWKVAEANPQFNNLHGHCANGEWTLENQSENSLSISFEYPENHPIKQIKKHFLVEENAKVSIKVEVLPKEDCELSLGIHPVFKLAEEAGKTKIKVENYGFVYSFPVDFEVGVSKLNPDTKFTDLAKAPTKDSQTLDLTTLPFDFVGEEVTQLCQVQGKLSLENLSEAYTATLEWNEKDFGNCLLWFSNGGRGGFPFEGKFRGLGVEPNAAAFGVGSPISASKDNPLAKLGAKTSVAFKANEVWQTTYSISIS